MLKKRVLHLSFDMSDPNQRLAYEYLCNMGRNKVDMVTVLVKLLSDRYGPIDAPGVRYLIPIVARSGIGQGAIIPQPTEGAYTGETLKSKKEQKPRKTKPKGASNTTGDIKKPESKPEPTRIIDNDEVSEDDPLGLIAKYDPERLAREQAGMTMEDIYR